MLQLLAKNRTLLEYTVCLLAIGTVLQFTSGACWAEDELPAKQQDSVTVAEISRWISELDDGQFVTRQRAQEKLERAGLPAFESVAETAREGSLESSTRALNILLAWSERAEDGKLRIAALEQIVGLRNRPKESQLAGEILADVREAIALAKITEMGGSYMQDVRSRVALVNVQGVFTPPLQVIIDSHWKGGAEGLEYLKDIRRMATLSFHSMPMNPDEIGIVHELPQLRWVELYGKGYSEETFSYLISMAPPGLEFDVRKSALLGVRGDSNHRNAFVANVEPDSAAEKAGIKKGDLIVYIEGVKVQDFKNLTQQISKYEGGDSASLTVARPIPGQTETEEVELKVTFDCWGEKKRSPDDDSVQLQIESVLKPRGIFLDRR